MVRERVFHLILPRRRLSLQLFPFARQIGEAVLKVGRRLNDLGGSFNGFVDVLAALVELVTETENGDYDRSSSSYTYAISDARK